MQIKSPIIQITLFFTTLMPFAYGQEATRFIILNQPIATDTWPDSYYVLYGFGVAAVVLFVMSIMKKHNEIS